MRVAVAPVRIAIAPALVAIAVAGCGGINPPAAGRGVVDDQRTLHTKCIAKSGLRVAQVGLTGVQVGDPATGAWIDFRATPGAAQQVQIEGAAQGAEVIGASLLYPRQTPDDQLKTIEACLAKGVQG
jgi:hypothetical protein